MDNNEETPRSSRSRSRLVSMDNESVEANQQVSPRQLVHALNMLTESTGLDELAIPTASSAPNNEVVEEVELETFVLNAPSHESDGQVSDTTQGSLDVLYDPNSQVNLLSVQYNDVPEEIQNDPVQENNFEVEVPEYAFPGWLLHLLADDIPEENVVVPNGLSQGDGLGVHSSVFDVEESRSSDGSSSNSDETQSDYNVSQQAAEALSLMGLVLADLVAFSVPNDEGNENNQPGQSAPDEPEE